VDEVKDSVTGLGVLEVKTLNALLKCTVQQFLTCGITKEFFTGEDAAAFGFIVKYIASYKVMPSLQTVAENGYGSIAEVVTPEPLDYYLDSIISKNIFNMFNSTLKQSADALKSKSLVDVAELMAKASTAYEGFQRTKDKVLTSNDLLSSYNKSVLDAALSDGIYTPWVRANRYGAVLRDGDLAVIAGRPGSGKTWLELILAHYCSTVQGKKVVMISLEMPDSELLFRYGAIEHGFDSTQLNKHELTTNLANKIKANKSENPVIFLGNSAVRNLDTVRKDVSIYTPDLLIIDAGYLLGAGKAGKSGASKYDRISTVVNGLKEIATEFQIPIIGSYQINREGQKAISKGDDLDLSHIAGSDDIPQLSSFVILLDSVGKDASERIIKIGKNRKGTEDSFKIRWDLQHMDFQQIEIEVSDSDA